MTTKRENAIRLVKQWADAENAQDWDRMYAVYAPEMATSLNGSGGFRGKREVMRDWNGKAAVAYGESFREMQWIEANDERVAFQYTVEFDHLGEIFGVPASGNRIQMHGAGIAAHNGESLLELHVFGDVGDAVRQLSGKLRAPGTVSAVPEGAPVPEGERARYEAVGARLIRTVYEAENERDIEKQLACYADPLLDHFAGHASAMSSTRARRVLPAWWESIPRLHRDIEEVLAFGDRAVLRWHMTADDIDGKPVDQHGCSVIEQDGERITKFWAYYPDLAQVFPAVLGLE